MQLTSSSVNRLKAQRISAAFHLAVRSHTPQHWLDVIAGVSTRKAYKSWMACVIWNAYRSEPLGEHTAFKKLMNECVCVSALDETDLWRLLDSVGIPRPKISHSLSRRAYKKRNASFWRTTAAGNPPERC